MTGPVKLSQVDAWRCRLPLARELRLGDIRYATRDVVVMRIQTEDGISGAAIGYTRGTPVLEGARTLIAAIIDDDVADADAVSRGLRRRFAPGWGGLVRSASLIDIALWDAAARRAGVPLARLFGAESRDLPLMFVAGYFLDERGPGAIVDEVREAADLGFRAIKLIVPGHDLDRDVRLVRDVREAVPAVDLGIDFHGAFADAQSAVGYLRHFEQLGVRFIEDPLPSLESDQVVAIARELATPIASGEDLVSSASYRILLDGGVRYLRADATASGGYETALSGIESAQRVGATVLPHVWPHIHHPLAATQGSVGALELITPETGADPIDLLLTEPFPIEGGRWHESAEPGLYLPIDWERVAALSDQHWQELAS